MFRITRGITIQHAPAFPNPSFRFPAGSPLPIHGDGESPEAPDHPGPGEIEPAAAAGAADPAAPGRSGEDASVAPS